MTALRQRMLEDMPIRTLAPATPRAYGEHVSRCARHVGRSPALLGPEEIRAYLVDLTTEKQLAPSTIIVAVAALRFLDTVTLRSSIIRISMAWSPAAASRLMALAGSPVDRVSSCRYGSARACVGAASWRRSTRPSTPAPAASARRSTPCTIERPFSGTLRQHDARHGSCTRSCRSLDPSRCWTTLAVTPTGSRSPTSGWSRSTTAMCASATRTTALTGRRPTKR